MLNQSVLAAAKHFVREGTGYFGQPARVVYHFR